MSYLRQKEIDLRNLRKQKICHLGSFLFLSEFKILNFLVDIASNSPIVDANGSDTFNSPAKMVHFRKSYPTSIDGFNIGDMAVPAFIGNDNCSNLRR